MKMIDQTKIETKKQKNLFLSIFCFCLALFISGCGDAGKTYEPEENFVVENHGRECTITGYKGQSMELNIPSKIGDRTVTAIGNNAFKECTAIIKVDIPDTVKKIGKSAFHRCTSLESITIPNRVTEIGDSAFKGCTSLKSVTIPKSVNKIGMSAFSFCEKLESITIPEGVAEIGSYTFQYCTSLKSITIPQSVKYIGYAAFYNCSLKEVKISKDCKLAKMDFQGHEPFDAGCKIIRY